MSRELLLSGLDIERSPNMGDAASSDRATSSARLDDMFIGGQSFVLRLGAAEWPGAR